MSQKRLTSPGVREKKQKDKYTNFEQLDGQHPWQTQVKEGHLLYPVRKLKNTKVSWFNFSLAKEMGLISSQHNQSLNKSLEKKILETFSLRILNEYDEEQNISYPKSEMKKNKYMATRYLQLQHEDKTGKTSGDGRCIWNGIIQNRGTTWDVSSRGTGVTALAPGVVQAGKPLESGNTDFGYGCGLAEIDELYGSAIMAEIMHTNSVHTERMLAIIDIGEGCAIGVRAGKNLFRPAHLFLYLKQGNYDALKNSTDFLIDRQSQNCEWQFTTKFRSRYRLMLDEVCERFAQFTAQLEREYIFAWLDWDGDNVLANGGIIDYGSVRQFGLRHDQYRYDDDDRFSTNLNEQKTKARLTVQVFAQLTNFLITREKKPLAQFKDHPILKKFDRDYERHLKDHFLFQVGYKSQQRKFLLTEKIEAVTEFYRIFSILEKMKTSSKIKKVADGVNRPAIYNMRAFLRTFAEHIHSHKSENTVPLFSEDELFEVILSEFANAKDSQLKNSVENNLKELQNQYINILNLASHTKQRGHIINDLFERSRLINHESRVTGNALINIVREIMSSRAKGTSDKEIQKIIDQFISSQASNPELNEMEDVTRLQTDLKQRKLGRTFLSLVQGYKEDI